MLKILRHLLIKNSQSPIYCSGSPGGPVVKNLFAMQEIWVPSRVWKDPLEKEMATHSSILAWKIPWTEEPVSLQAMGSQRVRYDWMTRHTYYLLSQISLFLHRWKNVLKCVICKTTLKMYMCMGGQIHKNNM